MTERRARDRRKRGVEVRLTSRDEILIRALARFRIADTGSLVRVCFEGVRRDTAARRLRLLYDAGWLDLRVPGRDKENLYVLGPRGRRLVAEQKGAVCGPPRGSLEHHLGIVRAWAAVASHGIPELEVVRALPDWEIRERLGAAGSELVPDLLVRFRFRGQPVSLSIEVDLGTESLPTLTDKIRRYEALRDDPAGLFGARGFGLGLVLGDRRREQQIREVLEAEWHGWSLVWSDPSEFSPVVRTALGVAAGPLTASPYRKGSDADLSAVPPSDPKEADTGL